MNKSQILEFVTSSSFPVTKREIAQAIGLKGGEGRVELKKILRTLEVEGAISKHPGGAYGVAEGLPGVTVIEVTDVSVDGDIFAKVLDPGIKTRIEIMPGDKGHPALKQGDRVLARLHRTGDQEYEARVIKRLDVAAGRVTGRIKMTRNGAVLLPADKRAKQDYEVPAADLNGAQDGDLVAGEIQPARGAGRRKVRITSILGKPGDPRAISLISLNEAGLREEFPEAAVAETQGMGVPPLGNHEDLRSIPLVTIDGADARDFDDAVFAERDGENYHLIVAIADVAYYVRPGSELDKEAVRRGNSTYFPDRVVPMLPEALSNDLCSLRPDEDRACLAVHMWIDGAGELLRHKFVRGLMRSKARLTYEQVQFLHDDQDLSSRRKPGSGNKEGGIQSDPGFRRDDNILKIITPLYEAFRILDQARKKRGALELDLPERQVIIDEHGNMTGVRQRARYDSHKVIEEFMILANVAAAQALEKKKAPCVYRVHDKPSMQKLDSAREFIESFGLSLPKGQTVRPAQLNHILMQAAEMPYSHLVSEVILRTQAQAHYSPENIGHFGLALTKYAHFTSPIRRYADLLVHRSLIRAYGLGEGGLDDGEAVRLEEICDNISAAERTSMEAERNAIDRFAAAYLSDRIGAQFSGRISGVTRFGLFIKLDESGADGLVPISTLPSDFYVHDESAHALIGRRSGRVFRLGAPVNVYLSEADGLTGSTILELAGHEGGADIPGMELKRGRPLPPDSRSGPRKKKGHGATPKHKRRARNKKR